MVGVRVALLVGTVIVNVAGGVPSKSAVSVNVAVNSPAESSRFAFHNKNMPKQ